MKYIEKIILFSAYILIFSKCSLKNTNNMNTSYKKHQNYINLKPTDADIVNYINHIYTLKENNKKRAVVIANELPFSKHAEYQNEILHEDEKTVTDMFISLKEQVPEIYNQLKLNKDFEHEHAFIQLLIYKKTEQQEEQERLLLQYKNDDLYDNSINYQYFNAINYNNSDIKIKKKEKENDNIKSIEYAINKDCKTNIQKDAIINLFDNLKNIEYQFEKICIDKEEDRNKNFDKAKFNKYLKYIIEGDLNSFNILIEKDIKFDIKMMDEKNETLILKACKYGKLNFIKRLEKLGGNLYDYNKDGDNCIILASKYLHLDILKYLNANISLKTTNLNYDTPLHLVANRAFCQNKNLQVIEFLISNGIEINATNLLNETPLLKSYKNKQIFIYLLRQNANYIIKSKYNLSPLLLGSLMGYFSVVYYIISEMRKNINLKEYKEQLNIALVCCSFKGHKKIAKFLLEKGAEINYKCTIFNNIIYKKNYMSILENISPNLLLFFNNSSYLNSITPILAASTNANIKFIKFLLNNKAIFDIKNISPLKYACICNNSEIIDFYNNKLNSYLKKINN